MSSLAPVKHRLPGKRMAAPFLTKSVVLESGRDRVQAMDIGAEIVSPGAPQPVLPPNCTPDKPAIKRHTANKNLPGPGGCGFHQAHAISVAANDAIKRDDICFRQFRANFDEITLHKAHAAGMTPGFTLLPRGFKIGRQSFDVYSGRNFVAEQFVLQDTDASANIKQRRIRDATVPNRRQNRPRGWIGSFAPVLFQIAARDLGTEMSGGCRAG